MKTGLKKTLPAVKPPTLAHLLSTFAYHVGCLMSEGPVGERETFTFACGLGGWGGVEQATLGLGGEEIKLLRNGEATLNGGPVSRQYLRNLYTERCAPVFAQAAALEAAAVPELVTLNKRSA